MLNEGISHKYGGLRFHANEKYVTEGCIMTPWLNVVIWVVLGCLAAVCANSRGRSPGAWFLIGSLLGWYGLLLLFILPPISQEEITPKEEKEQAPLPPEPVVEKAITFSPAGEWFFLDAAKTICGPVPPEVLKDKWKEGKILPESWVWSEYTVDWRKISQIQPLLDWLKQ